MQIQQPDQNKTRLHLGKVQCKEGFEGLGDSKVFVFPFLNEQGLNIFSLNAIADTVEHAADEIRDLLNTMMVAVCINYPKIMPLDLDTMQCPHCPFQASEPHILDSHLKVMHNQ